MKATSFATRQDLARFAKQSAKYLTNSELKRCLSVGDQGVGAWGDPTWMVEGAPLCALPKPYQHNQKVRVIISQLNKSVVCLVRDRAPAGVVDLNPAALKAFDLDPDANIAYEDVTVEKVEE